MRSVDVERSAEADVGRPLRAVTPPEVLDGVMRLVDVPRRAVTPPDMLDWSAAPDLVSVDAV